MTDTVLVPPEHRVPTAFTRAQLDWLPWLEPLAVDAMTERHMASLVDAARVKSPYFRLLARDPDRDTGPVRAGARRPPASRRARRSGDRRRHPRRGLLQLGQSPDALAR